MIPVTIIPWDRDFMTGLAGHLVENFPQGFQDVMVLFPHRRPKRYLVDRLLADPRLAKPCLLPDMVSIQELFARIGQAVHGRPLRPLGELDRVGLLHRVVRELKPGLRGLNDGFPEEVKDFFPWGRRLAGLMEELFQQAVKASDLDHVQDMVMPTAAALLANLKSIQTAYRELMLSENAATPGLMSALAAGHAELVPDILAGKHLLCCGFYALTGCEEALLKPLWRRGLAEIFWHTDPKVADRDGGWHWSCQEHADWLKSWKARAQVLSDVERSPLPAWRKRTDQLSLFAKAAVPPPRRAKITFHQGFDLHSQLLTLARELAQFPDTAGYCVVLPDTSMLMPVLHHLPRRDVNISMGFPMARSPVFQLVELLLKLQDGRTALGYHWREVIACLRHPLLKLLQLEGERPLRLLFHAWEEQIRAGEKYLDPSLWEPGQEILGEFADAQAVEALRQKVVEVCFTAFEDLATPRAMAEALLGLARLLMSPEHTSGHWERFVIDAQCLARLIETVIPELHGSAISLESFPPGAVRAMTRELLKGQRVPFEADPLSGLQVLGMLETRLLSFERIYVLGATEEVLPGTPRQDPLLPEPLRESLGLPSLTARDLVSAHTFYSLLQGARDIGLFYSSAILPGVLQGKSLPSRFVEQLLWEEEKRQGKLLGPQDQPRRLISLAMRGLAPARPAMPNSLTCRNKLETILRYRSLSPTFLDDYLHCPLRFFYKYLTPLEPLTEVAEEGDPPAFGELVHELLQDFFKDHLGQRVNPGDLDGERLCAEFSQRLGQAQFFRQMPADARLMLDLAGQERLRSLLAVMPPSTLLHLEMNLDGSLEFEGRSYRMRGKVDRVDRRENGLVVLDYKTGSVRQTSPGFWDDDILWAWIANSDRDLSLLPKLAKSLGSIQLPLYLYLYGQQAGELPANGLFVLLGQGGEEKALFTKSPDPEIIRERIMEQTPRLVRFLLDLILNAGEFCPQVSRACAWCPFQPACRQETPAY